MHVCRMGSDIGKGLINECANILFMAQILCETIVVVVLVELLGWSELFGTFVHFAQEALPSSQTDRHPRTN